MIMQYIRVYRPCMITLRKPTSFDAITPGGVAWVTVKRKKVNLDAREIYAQKPYYDSRAQVEILLGIILYGHHNQTNMHVCACTLFCRISARKGRFDIDYTLYNIITSL